MKQTADISERYGQRKAQRRCFCVYLACHLNDLGPCTTLEYYRSVFVTLMIASDVPGPVFKKQNLLSLTEVYHKIYTENITLTEQFEH